MGKKVDLVGKKFGLLTVTEYVGRVKWSYYMCKCDCGKFKSVRIDHLQSGKTISCGCERIRRSIEASTTHNQSKNPLCFIWHAMMNRCYNEEFQDYHNYGGRGIKVSDEWHDINTFINEVSEGYIKGLQLDRINNEEWYSKSNFKWSTRSENNRNKRTNRHIIINGVDKIAIVWAEEYGINYQTILGREKRGWVDNEILYGK
jgi:hypothetical protein